MEKNIKITTYGQNTTGSTIYTIYDNDIVALAYFEDIYNQKLNGRKFLEEELYGKDSGHTVNENIEMFYCLLKSGNENFNYSLQDFKKILSKDHDAYTQYARFQFERKLKFLQEMQVLMKNAKGEDVKKKAKEVKATQQKTS